MAAGDPFLERLRDRARAFIQRESGARRVEIMALERLSGGAVQQNYALDVDIEGGSRPGPHRWVLRLDAPSGLSVSLSRGEELAVLSAARAAGVIAPEPLWACTGDPALGRDYLIMERLPGTAAGYRLVRDAALDAHREALVEALGAELARIHSVRPPRDDLPFLALPAPSPALARVALYRCVLEHLPDPHPALEWALRWLARNAPETPLATLVHSDYRTGNYLVADGRLGGILDWEFATFGDPLEDIGWFCARCWRFGRTEREAGGMGSREAFYRGYAREAGTAVDGERVPYWEAMAAARWAVLALEQAERDRSGRERSLELALTGRLVPELELDLLATVDAIERARAA